MNKEHKNHLLETTVIWASASIGLGTDFWASQRGKLDEFRRSLDEFRRD